ncbi:MAG: hypothetical protein N7Q72_03760, partial [Spiroplasma sp. Tabriz.8]|nr:hypothetical protein [Spiroplasma sp. Tabriz.8]
ILSHVHKISIFYVTKMYIFNHFYLPLMWCSKNGIKLYIYIYIYIYYSSDTTQKELFLVKRQVMFLFICDL